MSAAFSSGPFRLTIPDPDARDGAGRPRPDPDGDDDRPDLATNGTAGTGRARRRPGPVSPGRPANGRAAERRGERGARALREVSDSGNRATGERTKLPGNQQP